MTQPQLGDVRVNDTAEPDRPDPDELLAQVNASSARERRGRLKIFFGACPGVGKTYAMLQALREQQREGVSVLVGVVETHGRAETQALLEGLPRLPLKSISYRGKALPEFDLDAALASNASLIAVDELAHSNVPGSRHAKRWQDVEELLAAGFDVYTTLNVQHLESVHDVVAAITGVHVRETVPDRLFDQADEVTLIDLPADDLIKRLKAGKVYMPEMAQLAGERFFRPGNLIALRELALRRVADRVDLQMREYRAQQAIDAVWPARERLLVAVGHPDEEPLIRAAARLATRLEAEWIAVHIDRTSAAANAEERARVLDLLSLARRLGAETVSVAGTDVATSLAQYARRRNANRIVLGARPAARRPWWRPRSMAERVLRQQPGLDLILVSLPPMKPTAQQALGHKRPSRGLRPYLWASAACAATTVLAWPLSRVFDLSNIVMLFLLAVVLVSLRWGRRAGAWAALLSVLCFDFFYVPPIGSFTVSDAQYLFTFTLMLTVALIIGQLTARLRFTAEATRQRERRAALQARLANALSGALTTERIVEIAVDTLQGPFEARVAIALPDLHDRISGRTGGQAQVDTSIAQWVLDHGEQAGAGTGTLNAAKGRYMPLKAPMRVRGVLVVEADSALRLRDPEELQLLEACAGQIAIALERVHFVEVAQDTLVQMESERLRNTLLMALSHDLRTPLTGILGATEVAAQRAGSGPLAELLAQIRLQAIGMQRLVDNLMQLARLQSGAARIDRQWHSLEEIIGSALHQLGPALAQHPLSKHLPADLPLVEVDALLLERALVNLLDNAVKHTPAGTKIDIHLRLFDDAVEIEVADEGPGLPPGDAQRLFEAFSRGVSESNVPGIGLGLALVERIAQAHGGTIHAERRAPHGSAFILRLPRQNPPADEDKT